MKREKPPTIREIVQLLDDLASQALEQEQTALGMMTCGERLMVEARARAQKVDYLRAQIEAAAIATEAVVRRDRPEGNFDSREFLARLHERVAS